MATVKKSVASKKISSQPEVPVPVKPYSVIEWRSLYLYAVCLVTLLVVLFSTVSMFNALIDVVFPDPTWVDPYAKPENTPNPELLAQQESYNQRQGIKSAFTSLITIAIATPVYIFHWRQARKVAS